MKKILILIAAAAAVAFLAVTCSKMSHRDATAPIAPVSVARVHGMPRLGQTASAGFKSRFLQPRAGAVAGELIVGRIIENGVTTMNDVDALPSSGVFARDIYDGATSIGTVYSDVWVGDDGLTHMNAIVATWQRSVQLGSHVISWRGSAGSLVLGAPLEFNSDGIAVDGIPVFVGYAPGGGWNVGVAQNLNGVQIDVNQVAANANGASSLGIHGTVPAEQVEGWFNGVTVQF